MLDHVVFAVRESPDWTGLARDHEAGASIDPARYAQPRDIPSFPTEIVALIGRWNALSPVDFFTCRQQLKAVATELLTRTARGIVTSHVDLPASLAQLTGQQFLVFFCDDDDWFAPDTVSMLSGLDLQGVDVAVFPLVRLALESFTLVRDGAPARAAVGPCHNFVLRYHTNNYALAPSACRPENLPLLREHRTASFTADRLGFVDRYFDISLSATNKTPCSASLLAEVVADEGSFQRYIRTYLRNLKRLMIPDALAWMRAPLWETIRLFEQLVPRSRRL